MPTRPQVDDDEVMAVCRQLILEGRDTLKNVREALGGGGQGRLLRLLQSARRESADVTADAPPSSGEEPSALPIQVQDALARVSKLVASALHDVRHQEGERARAAEAALQARHHVETTHLQALIAERDQESLALAEEMEALEAELAVVCEANDTHRRLALTREQLLADASERHARECREMHERTESVRSEATAAREAQRVAEVAAARMEQLATDAGAEVARLRLELEREGASRRAAEEAVQRAQLEVRFAEGRVTEAEATVAQTRRELADIREEAAALRARMEATDQFADRLTSLVKSPTKPSPGSRRGKPGSGKR